MIGILSLCFSVIALILGVISVSTIVNSPYFHVVLNQKIKNLEDNVKTEFINIINSMEYLGKMSVSNNIRIAKIMEIFGIKEEIPGKKALPPEAKGKVLFTSKKLKDRKKKEDEKKPSKKDDKKDGGEEPDLN